MVETTVQQLIDSSALPALMEFVRVPSVSPLFAPDWRQTGLINQAMDVMVNWTKSLDIQGLTLDVITGDDHPPLLFIDISGEAPAILLYGHMDKQPAGPGWTTDPYTPTVSSGYLYGRGSADDGYALTSMLVAIKACQLLSKPHHHCVILIENEEESGSPHLIPIINTLKDRIIDPELVVCMDIGAGDYGHLWSAESIRGLMRFDLNIRTATREMHSGTGGGVVPSPWTVLMELLSRVEDAETGEIKVKELCAEVSPEMYARTVGGLVTVREKLDSFQSLVKVEQDLVQCGLNYTNRPTLTITGLDGAPSLSHASSVLLPALTVRCSIRLPPTVQGSTATAAMERVLLASKPYHSTVTVTNMHVDEGWCMSPLPGKIVSKCNEAAALYFGNEPLSAGRGGSIPFVKPLQQLFPSASVLLWGAAGPDSSPHGPNERLNLSYYHKLTCCLQYLLEFHQ